MNRKRVLGGLFLVVLLTANVDAASLVADAAMNKDRTAVRTLLNQRADVNASQTDGTTALHWAARWDDVEMADLLIRGGANVKARNRAGATPIYLAAVNGSVPMIEKLLAAGEDANVRLLSAGESPLMVAARTGKIDAVKTLLDRGATPNLTEKLRGTTALMWAAEQNHPNVIALLASRGTDLNMRSTIHPAPRRGGNSDDPSAEKLQIGGLTALMFAAREGGLEAVKALVAAGADVNVTAGDGATALLVAVMNGNYELATFLLDRGANPNIANSRGWTPLYSAVKNRNLETGAVPLMKTGTITDEMVVIKALLERGADPNLRMKADSQSRNGQGGTWLDENGATPFLRAALSGDLSVLKLLLSYGADPNIPTEENVTPMMALAGVGYAEGFINHHSEEESLAALKLLLDLGADVNAASNSKSRRPGLTALHGAGHRGANKEIQFLVDNGAVLDRRDNHPPADGGPGKYLPLDWAVGVRISAASPIFKSDTVDLIIKLMRDRGMEVPAAVLGTVGGKRSAAGTGIKD